MKTVRIPVEIVDNINPTITAPDSVLLTRLEGLPSEINISAQDNNKGVGLKDGNPITVENLPNPLFYNPKTSKIEINGVIPNNFQNGKSSIQVTVKAVDRKGNTATKNIIFNIQSQTQKYTAVANPKIQEVSHAQTPDPGTSISTTGLPANTQYKWERKPDTNTPGNKDGVVKVTYPDGSTDIVNVTVKVRKLSDEHEPTGTKIVKNQNDSVSNNDLKAAVTINNNGNSKVKSVTSLGNISTTNAGTQTINATVTYLDGTTDPVTIPLEVKDITAPTIQTPTDRQNWDLIALDRTLPSIKLTSEDNTGGTGIKSTTVTGLPDFLVYDNATKTIKFKNGVQEVTKLPDGQDSKTYNVNIQVTDNSNNSSRRQVTITVKSMTTKYSATANPQKQTVSYGQTPNAETSINKNGLPTGTTYTWRTIPNTTTGPGQKAGVVIVTYPDGSTDLVDVTVDVRKLSDEYEPTGTKIVKNQNATVTNDDLKAAVIINNNGNSKVKSVTPVGNISTTNAGTQTINATVTYLDDTTDSVTIPLEVKDVIAPTIQTPTEGQLWEITSLDKTLPPIRVETSDNSGGSGVKSIVPINLPSFLKFDKETNSIVFQDGVREVPKLSGINRTTKTVTLRVEDNAGNSSERTFQIRQISMAEKYSPQANETIQEVSHREIPNPKTSINTAELPAGIQYTWKSTPDTSKPGDKTGVVTVTYPDDSIDEVNVTVKVRKLSDEYEPTATKIVKNQNESVSNDELKAAVTISNNGASKVKSVTPVNEISTTEFGDKTINATVTYLDDTTDTVTIPLKVKDVTPPTIQAPIENTNWEMTALDKTLPNMEVRAEDNANGSGIKSISVTGLPDYLEYDSATNSIKFKAGKQEVEKLSENTPSKEFNLNIRVEDIAGNVSERTAKIVVSSISTKTNPQPENQTVNYGQIPNPEDSVNKQGLPDGTTVTWKTPPVVNTPGSTTGEVEITYPDGSKDVITVNVTVRKVSEEFTATGTQIEVNQNEEVTSDMLKGAVNATNAQGENGNAKIAKVESKSPINTVAYGDQTIQAKVTYIDGSEQDVTIQLKVKDVTKPTIQAPTNGQNWDLIAVEGENPNISVTSEDNAGGSGVKSTTVTGLPDFLEYNEATKTIQFKAGITSVPSLSEGTDVEPYNVTITVVDNAGNETTTNVTITVKSMTTKYDAIPNSEKQTVSYGETPDAATSVNTSGLPEGTSYAWKTTPNTNTPGEKDGVVEVTYKDGSKDTVNVKVTVKELSSEYEVTGSLIEVNQNIPVTNDDLKAKVTATSKVGNVTGTDKIAKVEAKAQVSTAAYGETNIEATVTFKDGTTKDVTIPLKVKDVTKPTIQAPTNGQNWDLIAVEGQDPNIAVTSEDNAGGSGVKSTTVTNLPDFLAYDEATKTIKFKTGVTQVPSLPEGTDVQAHNVTITVTDNAGNKTSTQVTITVKSMTTKYDAAPNSEKQTVSYGATPDAATSVDKTNLPEGTSYAWKTTPDTNTPGEKDGVVEVTYKDGSKDTVNVKVNVNKLSDEYNV
ncbi:Rib/alpha-like domain-containing protein, partial [Gemella haemolysans]